MSWIEWAQIERLLNNQRPREPIQILTAEKDSLSYAAIFVISEAPNQTITQLARDVRARRDTVGQLLLHLDDLKKALPPASGAQELQQILQAIANLF